MYTDFRLIQPERIVDIRIVSTMYRKHNIAYLVFSRIGFVMNNEK